MKRQLVPLKRGNTIMPMIKLSYVPRLSEALQTGTIGQQFETALREAIESIRPKVAAYGVMVVGGPYGPISHGQPDLRVEIQYKKEWWFSDSELRELVDAVKASVEELLVQAGVGDATVKVMFYMITGYMGSK